MDPVFYESLKAQCFKRKGYPLSEMKNQHHAIVIPQKAVHEQSTIIPLPSLKDISDHETRIQDPGNCEIVHTAMIDSYLNVYLDGALIAESPKLKQNKKGKDIPHTQAEKLRFCKAVIYFLINDQENLKDHLCRIGYTSTPFIVPVPVDIPDYVGAYTSEALTGYPEDRFYIDLNLSPAERGDILEMIQDDPGHCDMGFTRDHYDDLEQMEQIEPADEIIAAFSEPAPVISAKIPGYIPYLKLSIQEVPA